MVAGGAAVSTRYVTAADNLGFSLHGVRLAAGASTELWYRHHLGGEPHPRRRPGRDRPCNRRHPSTRTRRALSRRPFRPPPDRDARRGASHQRVQSAARRPRESRRGRRLSSDGADSAGSGPDVGHAVRSFSLDAWPGTRLQPFVGRDDGASPRALRGMAGRPFSRKVRFPRTSGGPIERRPEPGRRSSCWKDGFAIASSSPRARRPSFRPGGQGSWNRGYSTKSRRPARSDSAWTSIAEPAPPSAGQAKADSRTAMRSRSPSPARED